VSADTLQKPRHVGITGTRHGMTDAQRSTLIDLLSEGGIWLHHGCCVGVDEQAHWIAFELGVGSIGHPPADRRLAMPLVEDGLQFIGLCPPKPYHDRNRDIVDACSLLIAVPEHDREQPKGGTWYTVRYARQVGREHIIIWPDGCPHRVAAAS
jgi:predicted Rossmann fold nucleotide-binding protein DprA/Smf involved in DNA uptake